MRVIVNGLLALRRRTGIGSYVANLVDGLRHVAGPDRIHAFPGEPLRTMARVLARGGAGGPPRRFGISKRLLARSRELARRAWHAGFRMACATGRFDLYHEPNYLPWPTDLPTVVTVHDLSAVLHPEWHPADRVAMFEKHFLRRLRECRHVLTDSECVRVEVIRELGLPPQRVTAIPLGVGSDLRPLPPEECRPVLKRLGLPDDYLLHVGTIEPRKNLLMLLQAYCSLPTSLRERCPLVLAGAWGWGHADVAAFFDDTARHHNVRHIGFVRDADLPAIYAAARALVFPTHYEGFGLPPLEMMACGGAVIASTARAVREVVGDRACLLDPLDEGGWHVALTRVISDDDWCDDLRRGTRERAARFTWDRCARATWGVYLAALGADGLRHAA